ncbi:PREDICTED: probable indole-3-acetic acid-amido synthetase GH3.6 [Nelumbo nucifera]|uniref:Probable indole-3-acetic acid-amido synthetase GH3.6 n=1 Tax=Nelumbo nucifera TaxID=4432 RepID=A0A1U8PZL6_NELNU|nr:PREDICTED: probable indole-3-acetic acid-amido synthetase GH3.6 [Nelumbo nucifera]
MRDAVAELLGGPQPELSKTIRAALEGRQFGGILGEIPVLGGDYFASECCIAINLDRTQPPDQTRYVLLTTAAYFEFLPFDLVVNHGIAEETVDCSEVEIGKMYEVVVTTCRGLYRFRRGDIVRVLSFHNLSLELKYVMRAPKATGEVFT